jgi:prevent-host-death family protein
MSKRIAAADARRDFAEVIQQSSRGERIHLTRYGKTQAVLIPARDLEALEDCEEPATEPESESESESAAAGGGVRRRARRSPPAK